MQRTLRKILHITLGIFFLIVGVLGLVLPILNGLFFLIIGFIILSFESPYVERKLVHFARKNKTAHHWYLTLEKFIRKIFKK